MSNKSRVGLNVNEYLISNSKSYVTLKLIKVRDLTPNVISTKSDVSTFSIALHNTSTFPTTDRLPF